MEMELPGKRKRGRPKRIFLDVVKEDMGEVGARGRTLKTGRCGGTSYAVANARLKKKAKRRKRIGGLLTTKSLLDMKKITSYQNFKL